MKLTWDEILEQTSRVASRIGKGQRLLVHFSEECQCQTPEGVEAIRDDQAYCHLCGGVGWLAEAKTWRGS